MSSLKNSEVFFAFSGEILWLASLNAITSGQKFESKLGGHTMPKAPPENPLPPDWRVQFDDEMWDKYNIIIDEVEYCGDGMSRECLYSDADDESVIISREKITEVLLKMGLQQSEWYSNWAEA